VRHFRLKLVQLETFPFYAFNLESPSEISVMLSEESHGYSVIRGGRPLLPLKPIPSLKKLSFSFKGCASILASGEHLAHLFPSLTDLILLRGGFSIATDQLTALPSTLRRLRLHVIDSPDAPKINLNTISKMSQNLELMDLGRFEITVETGESLQDFKFSDSLLDISFCVDSSSSQLISKLPRFVERVHIATTYSTMGRSETFSISLLPATLRSFKLSPYGGTPPFILDGPFPPQLEEWSARTSLGRSKLVLPSSLQRISFGIDTLPWNYERGLNCLQHLDKSFGPTEADDVLHFPNSLLSLHLGPVSADAMSIIPKTLVSLILSAEWDIVLLTQDVCDRLEALEELECYLHHFESSSCLSSFKRIKKLEITVSHHASFERQLFSKLNSPVLCELRLRIQPRTSCKLWNVWISQLEPFRSIRTLYCNGRDVTIPEYLKCLPPSLTALSIPSPSMPEKEPADTVKSSPEFLDCFKKFPSTLTKLTFQSARTTNEKRSIPDDCFANLPPSLTQLDLNNTADLSNRFWEIIPPNIRVIKLEKSMFSLFFLTKLKEYYSKFNNVD
jgi:hypothetical protein